jgi:hypothetical protein
MSDKPGFHVAVRDTDLARVLTLPVAAELARQTYPRDADARSVTREALSLLSEAGGGRTTVGRTLEAVDTMTADDTLARVIDVAHRRAGFQAPGDIAAAKDREWRRSLVAPVGEIGYAPSGALIEVDHAAAEGRRQEAAAASRQAQHDARLAEARRDAADRRGYDEARERQLARELRI